MNSNKIYVCKDVFSKVSEDKSMITTTDERDFDFLELDGLSSVIWNFIYTSQGCTREEIIEEVSEQYECDSDELSSQLEILLEELSKLKLIQEDQ